MELYLTGVGEWQICVSLLFVFGEARTCFGEMTGDHEEDGISQAGHMVSGVLGVFFYVSVLRKILPEKLFLELCTLTTISAKIRLMSTCH